MSLKLKEENQVVASFGSSLMDDDLIVINELSLLTSNIRREVINVLDLFFSFLRIYDGRKTHVIGFFDV